MAVINEAKGYGISDTSNYTSFSVKTYPLKTQTPDDVTIAISHCGVCGSDVHTITGGWGSLSVDWCVPGHEIVGEVIAVGDNVTEFKVGDRAGVGAQVSSCLQCSRCNTDNENYCVEQLDTYNAKYSDGVAAQGGYATHIRAHQRFVFAIPDSIQSVDAAPMLCAGLTVYSPMVRNGTGPGSTIGIVGIGGLGHFAIQFGKALGAKVVVFSHSPFKRSDSMSLGATAFVDTTIEGFAGDWQDKIDLIISAADVASIPLSEILSTLKIGGKCVSVGLPDQPWKGLQPTAMAGNMSSLGCSHIGSKKEAYEMLALAAKHKIKPVIDKVLPMAHAPRAVESVKAGKAKYRFVLTNDLA